MGKLPFKKVAVGCGIVSFYKNMTAKGHIYVTFTLSKRYHTKEDSEKWKYTNMIIGDYNEIRQYITALQKAEEFWTANLIQMQGGFRKPKPITIQVAVMPPKKPLNIRDIMSPPRED